MLRRRRSGTIVALAAGLAVAVAAVVLAVARGSDGEEAGCRMLLIPAYVPPDELRELARVAPPRLVVINPASGPGAAAQEAYAGAVAALRRGGARVLGYVPTGYGTRDPAQVRADVDRYAAWYGVDGIFLDEVAHAASLLPYYRGLTDHVRGPGDRTVVLNPGVVPDRAYFDLADVVVTFEGAFPAYAAARERAPEWTHELPREQVAVLVYGASREQAAEVVAGSAHAGYVYATPGVLPHPWGTVPDYIREEASMLDPCTSGVAEGAAG